MSAAAGHELPPPVPLTVQTAEAINICAGPGGWEVGAKLLGLTMPILGIDIDADACVTARAAGFPREQGDVTVYDPAQFTNVKTALISTPCQTLSKSGKGMSDLHYQMLLDVMTHVGSRFATFYEPEDDYTEYRPDCDCTWEMIQKELSAIPDVRTRLLAQALRWATWLPNVEYLAMENVPGAEPLFEDLSAELFSFGWDYVNVAVLDAADYGVASRRRRAYLIARKHMTHPSGTFLSGVTAFPPVSMAQALGWEPGHVVNTRGNRRTSGGNNFSADRPAWCVTGKARGWYRLNDHQLLTPGEAGLLNGFPVDYPWTGSRSKQFQQIADVVSPVMAAVVLGTLLNIDWSVPVRAHLDAIYPTPSARHGAVPTVGRPRGRGAQKVPDLQSMMQMLPFDDPDSLLA